jgi:hypothetical protein
LETGVANVEILEDSGPLRLAVGFGNAISLLEKITWRPEQIMQSPLVDSSVGHEAGDDQQRLLQSQLP